VRAHSIIVCADHGPSTLTDQATRPSGIEWERMHCRHHLGCRGRGHGEPLRCNGIDGSQKGQKEGRVDVWRKVQGQPAGW
jgi:hypothetical protein